MSTGGGFRRRGQRAAWVDLGLRIHQAGGDVNDYRDMMEEIQTQRGRPYRDIRYRNLFLRDRRLYRQLRQAQQERYGVTEELLSRRLPPELVRSIIDYVEGDETRQINRITNRRST